MNDDRRRPRRGPAALLRRRVHRHRRVRRDAEPAAQRRTTSSPIRGPDDLAKVPIAAPRPTGRRPGSEDVADVKIDHQPLIGDAVINGGDGLMLIVEKLPWANTLDVTEGVEEAMAEMQPGLPGIEIDTTIFRPATFVEISIDNLIRGAAPRRAARGDRARAVPVLLAQRADQPDHDPAVAHRVGARPVLAGHDDQHDGAGRVRRSPSARSSTTPSSTPRTSCDGCDSTVASRRSRSTARVIFDASLEVRGAVVYASMIEALALLPVFFLTGLTGAFFRPLAMSYALAVLVSMLVALITTPALSLILLGRAQARNAASRRSSGGCSAATSGCSPGRPHGRSAAYAAVALMRPRWACWPCPGSVRSCSRSSRSATSSCTG